MQTLGSTYFLVRFERSLSITPSSFSVRNSVFEDRTRKIFRTACRNPLEFLDDVLDLMNNCSFLFVIIISAI